MPKMLTYAAVAAALTIAGPVLAQATSPGAAHEATPQTTPPSSTATPTPATSGSPSQAPGTTAPSSPSAAPPASTTEPSATTSGSNAAANAGANPEVTSGMSVKDNTGAIIGEITAVKGDMATIKMGSDTFTVDTVKLGVQGGAATINASQAELKKMLPKK